MKLKHILLPLALACTATNSYGDAGVVEIRATGMQFEGPSTILSGWTTFRFINTSNMLHFAMIDDPPEGVTAELMSETSVAAFQEAMDAMNAGNQEAVNTAFGKFPAWVGDMAYRGGPGFLSGGLTSETTVYLEPGYYVLECYIKTGGVFHTTSPASGALGMLHELEVTEEESGANEPSANVSVKIDNARLSIADGSFRAGANVIKVNFLEQQAFPTFVGNDVHILRLDSPEDLPVAADWMDWRKPRGLETPAPATFLGGINDMPAGSHGYIHITLEPGDYALIGETPEPLEQNFALPFSVVEQAPTQLECSRDALTAPSQCMLGDGNVGFALQATSGSSLNTLTLTPIGLDTDNSTQSIELDGSAYLAELADLDGNGWPEVYVYVSSAGSGSYGSLVAYAVNNGKSATPIYLPPITGNAEAAPGYQGHDVFRVVENRLVRRFPVYRQADTNASPSGGTRQVQYRLEAGEAGWVLEADQVVNY